MDIRMIKDILRLKYQGGLSHERIALSLGVSKGAVAKYLSLAGGAGLDWASTAELFSDATTPISANRSSSSNSCKRHRSFGRSHGTTISMRGATRRRMSRANCSKVASVAVAL